MWIIITATVFILLYLSILPSRKPQEFHFSFRDIDNGEPCPIDKIAKKYYLKIDYKIKIGSGYAAIGSGYAKIDISRVSIAEIENCITYLAKNIEIASNTARCAKEQMEHSSSDKDFIFYERKMQFCCGVVGDLSTSKYELEKIKAKIITIRDKKFQH